MIFDKVKEMIVDTLGCEEEAVGLSADLKEDLEADSIDAVELGMALEEEFQLTIDEDALMSFATVKDIVDYIEKNLA